MARLESESTHVPPGCGIVGTANIDTSPEVLTAMTDAVAHRGPDGGGYFTSPDNEVSFGHRRLAIVGVDSGGAQPMHREYPNTETGTADGITVTFNGEIYNYPHLKRELEGKGFKFTSASDTEVLLHGARAWGVDGLVKRLNGIFAFGLYNDRSGELTLARDHVGVKPVLWASPDGHGVLFASEAKSLQQHPKMSWQPDLDTIRTDMVHGAFGSKHGTWFKGVHNLLPGHYMTVNTKTGEQKTTKYWDSQQSGRKQILDEAQAAAELRSLFEESVGMQLMSDVGLITTLSGGLDSSANTAAAARIVNDVVTAINIEYDDSADILDILGKTDTPPEFRNGTPAWVLDAWHARKMARENKNIDLVHVQVPKLQMDMASIDRAVLALGQMPYDLRMVSMLAIYGRVREMGQKVVLIGQGPDELWMGYYNSLELWRLSQEQTSSAFLSQQFYPDRVMFGFDAFNPGFLDRQTAQNVSAQNLARNYDPYRTGDVSNDLTKFAERTALQSVLAMEDALSMAQSVEARVPWLDHRIVSLTYDVPSWMKLAPKGAPHSREKWVNRQAMKGLVPDHIIFREKSPFPDPPDAYRDQMMELITPQIEDIKGSAFMKELFRPDFLRTLDSNPALDAKALFRLYSLWRFGVLNNF